MDKSPEAFRTISEVSEVLETPAHVLRFWETRFPQIRPVKRAGGRRYYRPSDVALLQGIKRLLHEDGMTIRGVQKLLREHGIRHVTGLRDDSSPEQEALEAAMIGRFDAEPAAVTLQEAADSTAAALAAALAVPPDAAERVAGKLDADSRGSEVEPAAAPADNNIITFPRDPDVIEYDPRQITLPGFEPGPEDAAAEFVIEALAPDWTEDWPENAPERDLGPSPSEIIAAQDEVPEAPFIEAEEVTYSEAVLASFPSDAILPSEPAEPQAEQTAQTEVEARAPEAPEAAAATIAMAEPAAEATPKPEPAPEPEPRRAAESLPNQTLATRLRALPAGSLSGQTAALSQVMNRMRALQQRMEQAQANH